ncbi:MAG: HAMP domain-containing sensor histidine kinase [Lautropia sp.]|nr:HAMP domain-containing sensor histidine kinase [Lautropia sp.]
MNTQDRQDFLESDELPLQQAGTFWTSLRYLADGRLIIALLLLIYIPVLGPDTSSSLPFQRSLFISLTAFYMGFAVLCSMAVRRIRRGFSWQLFTQITLDVLVLGLIVYASNGRSGLGALMITPVAGVAILSATLPALAAAAAASMMLLGETALRILRRPDLDTAAIGNELMISAFISATLFFTALVISRLARRLAMQERLAIRRGEDLRNQRAIHALVVAELDQGVVVFNPRGIPRDLNPKARRLLNLPMGVPVAQADPQIIKVLRQILDAPGKLADLQIRRQEGTIRLRARVLTGSNIPAEDLGESPYYPDADNGRAGRALLDRVVLLEDLERIEDQAQQLKLASMGRLSASIAHEIRNPLAAIRHAGALLGEQAVAPAQKRLAEIIEKSSLRIDRIVEDVLSMARRGALSEVFDLRTFMAQFMPEFLDNARAHGRRVMAEDGQDRVALRCDSRAKITFDPNHLRQILINLLSNGLRYATERAGGVLVLWAYAPSGMSQLWVLDDGPGIAVEQRAHLFEPFFTTDPMGTGLGLHLTQELCMANGATIRYEAPSLLGEDIRERYGAGFVITPEQRPVADTARTE